MSFHCGSFIVHPRLGRIHGPSGTVHLRPKTIDVLVVLALANGEVVGRRELVRIVWGGAIITDAVVTNAISELRRAFGESARTARQIETVPCRGYRLATPAVFEVDGRSTSPRRPLQQHDPCAHLSGATAEHYHSGLLLLRGSSYQQIERGIEKMREVVRREPSFASAHSELARGYFILASWGRTTGRVLLPRLEAAASRAVEHAPESADSQLWVPMAQIAATWHPQLALAPLGRILRRHPSHVATRDCLAHCLAALGRLPEAVELQIRALDDDPFSPALRAALGFFLRLSGRLEEAEQELLETLEMHPSWAISRIELARVHLAQRQTRRAVEDLHAVKPEWAEFLAAVEGRRADVAPQLAAWQAPGSGAAPYWLAERCMWAGQEASALKALERALMERQLHLLYIAVEPTFLSLHRHRRFQAILTDMGLINGGEAGARSPPTRVRD